MPAEIDDMVNKVAAAASSCDHKQTIRERLKAIMDLFRFSRYKPTARGKFMLDAENGVAGGEAKARAARTEVEDGEPGSKGGRGGDIYSLFLSVKSVPGEEVVLTREPEVRWISGENGTRTAGDLEDRVAKFVVEQGLVLANVDFPVFNDMIDRSCTKYKPYPAHAPWSTTLFTNGSSSNS